MHDVTSNVRTASLKTSSHQLDVASISIAHGTGQKNDDTVYHTLTRDRLTLLVADGATGFGYGDVASKALRDFVTADFDPSMTSRQMKSFLLDADTAVRHACQADAEGADTTGILMTVHEDKIEGASAGDSQAFIFGNSTCELTSSQRRRPRIGNGGYPQDFTGRITPGDVLVVATDGLWNRLDQKDVGRICLSASDARQAVEQLTSAARTTSGTFDDDISIICVKCS